MRPPNIFFAPLPGKPGFARRRAVVAGDYSAAVPERWTGPNRQDKIFGSIARSPRPAMRNADRMLLEDVRSLLVGPAWLLGFVYKRFGIAY
jgi:hypothetical protein